MPRVGISASPALHFAAQRKRAEITMSIDSAAHVHTHCGVKKPILSYGGNLRCLAPVRLAHTELELCSCGASRFIDVLNEYVQPDDWAEADELSSHMLKLLGCGAGGRASPAP